MSDRNQVIARLRELQRQHAAALGEGPGDAPGFIQDEQHTRKSYKTVLHDALGNGVLTKEDLAREGLPDHIE